MPWKFQNCFNCFHLFQSQLEDKVHSIGNGYPWAPAILGLSLGSEEENQKLKEMIQSLGAGRTVDAQTFEDLGRKPGNPVHWSSQSPSMVMRRC